MTLYDFEQYVNQVGFRKYSFLSTDQDWFGVGSCMFVYGDFTRIRFCFNPNIAIFSVGTKYGSTIHIQSVKDVACSEEIAGLTTITFLCDDGKRYKFTAI